jgi:hypothetical protein
MTFPIFIFCCARSWQTKGKDSMRWLVSQRFQADYRFWFENEVKVYEFYCEMDTDCPQRIQLLLFYWLTTTPGNCCLPSCWSAGVDCEKMSSVTYALKFYVQCVLLVLIRNFLLERRSSSTQAIHNFCVTLSFFFLKRKRIDRARVDNKVDSQMFMLPVI